MDGCFLLWTFLFVCRCRLSDLPARSHEICPQEEANLVLTDHGSQLDNGYDAGSVSRSGLSGGAQSCATATGMENTGEYGHWDGLVLCCLCYGSRDADWLSAIGGTPTAFLVAFLVLLRPWQPRHTCGRRTRNKHEITKWWCSWAWWSSHQDHNFLDRRSTYCVRKLEGTSPLQGGLGKGRILGVFSCLAVSPCLAIFRGNKQWSMMVQPARQKLHDQIQPCIVPKLATSYLPIIIELLFVELAAT